MSNELVELVQGVKRITRVKAFLQTLPHSSDVPVYDKVMIGDLREIEPYLQEAIHYELEVLSHKSALGIESPLFTNARIEQGALIRKGAKIEDDAVILMGAVLNTGCKIGSQTMVDMNAVVGSGAQIGKRCHIGAGAVIAGMMEPASNIPVIIEDDVFIGANAVILEGVKIGTNSIVGAGAVVAKDVEKDSVVVGVPAHKIRENHKGPWIEKGLRL